MIEAAKRIGAEDDAERFQSWLDDLEQLSSALEGPLEKYPDPRFGSDDVAVMLAPTNLGVDLEQVRSVVKEKYPEATPEQEAWDTLTRLEENLKLLEGEQSELEGAERADRRAASLLESFVGARDAVLGRLYEQVKDRFVEHYCLIHGPDEAAFTASIEPDDAGLALEVDFYGRGAHPPHALHSEGHQDSMGLCLYLALAEQLTQGVIDLVMLDDVVMSVDTGHRRQVCHLLATCFPDRQFLITTHDKTWANQLRAEGIADSRGMVEFYNWHVQTGPIVGYEVDMWRRIEEDLGTNQVSSAAARLRRGSEQFFSMVCDALGGQVTYRLDGRLELGDFLPAAMGRYRSLLKKAKKAAQSWGDDDNFEMFQELDSVVGQVYTRTHAEQWAVNAAVHYSNWENLSPNDFRPVVEAFQDLHAMFVCARCGAMLAAAVVGKDPVTVRCNCGKVQWNLKAKGTTG